MKNSIRLIWLSVGLCFVTQNASLYSMNAVRQRTKQLQKKEPSQPKISTAPEPKVQQPSPELKPKLSPKKSAFKELIQDFKTTFGAHIDPQVAQALDDTLAGKKVALPTSPEGRLGAPTPPENIIYELEAAKKAPTKKPVTKPVPTQPKLSPAELLEQRAFQEGIQQLQPKPGGDL